MGSREVIAHLLGVDYAEERFPGCLQHPTRTTKQLTPSTPDSSKTRSATGTHSRHTKAYKQWRCACLVRDAATCVLCGKPGHHVDHIEPWHRVRDTSRAYDVTNGRVLCPDCHADQPTTPLRLRNKLRRM